MALYSTYDTWRRCATPLNWGSHAWAHAWTHSASPLSSLPGASGLAAMSATVHRLVKDYPKPAFAIDTVTRDGEPLTITERTLVQTPFCRLLHFERRTERQHCQATSDRLRHDPAILLVAPLSGHYATLLRDTVRTLLPDHDVYVTDWINARDVPAGEGPFGLDDYVATVDRFIDILGAARLHVMAVCQPVVPVLAAVALRASRGESTPRSMVLMGGPVDARQSPTAVNGLATERSLQWFESHLIHRVPAPYRGRGRRVYPGFLQHLGFVAMNPRRHAAAHWQFFKHLLHGDHDSAQAHREFYDEYNAVLDLPAQFYLDTIRTVFQEHLLPRGLWQVAGQRVRPQDIRSTALMTIEGGRDDISGQGQTQAAHALCSGLVAAQRRHLLVPDAGHYGLFSGRRWRTSIYPHVKAFMADQHKTG